MDDLISRNAALDYHITISDLPGDTKIDVLVGIEVGEKMYRKHIKGLPTAEAQPKEGLWLDLDSSNEKYDHIKCSECGAEFAVDAHRWCDIGQIKEDFIYCPHCGARMETER